MMTGFLSRPEVAAWLKLTPQKFQKMRPRELAALGFPDPAFGTRNGERWDPDTLAAWRRSLMPEHLRAIAASPAEDPDADLLDRRAVAIARGEKVH